MDRPHRISASQVPGFAALIRPHSQALQFCTHRAVHEQYTARIQRLKKVRHERKPDGMNRHDAEKRGEKEREQKRKTNLPILYFLSSPCFFLMLVASWRFICSRLYAPYLPNRPACAIAKGNRYIAWNWPSPPCRHCDSPNSVTASVRHDFATNTTGTGCQLWLLSLLGVL